LFALAGFLQSVVSWQVLTLVKGDPDLKRVMTQEIKSLTSVLVTYSLSYISAIILSIGIEIAIRNETDFCSSTKWTCGFISMLTLFLRE